MSEERGSAAPGEKIVPVILCGGSGTRLWPMSNEALPKQLLALAGPETLLQSTIARLSSDLFEPPVIVTRESLVESVLEQVAAIGAMPGKMLVEPTARNTAPAIGAAALAELAGGGDPVLLVMPSDHVIADPEAFEVAIRAAIPAATAGELVTFGIVPRWPETGYGYIEFEPEAGGAGASKAIRFTEKPDRDTAAGYLAGSRHLWNGGIFLFRASSIVRELKEHAPAVVEACHRAVASAAADGPLLRLDDGEFAASPSISIDYAVLEKSSRVSVIPASMEWSDIGSWDALWEAGAKDGNGNVVSGEAVLLDCRDCLIRNETATPVAVVDSTELIVVVTESGTLVVPRSSAQKAKAVLEALNRKAQG